MKNKTSAICLLIFTTVLFSCSKRDLQKESITQKDPFLSLKKPVISAFTVNSRSYHNDASPINTIDERKRNEADPEDPQNPDPTTIAYKDGPGLIVPKFDPDKNKDYLFLYQKYKAQMFTIADQAMALNIYPGAILDGRSIENVFDPKMLQGVSDHIRPITISTSMPVSGSAVAYTSLPRPIAEKTLYNTALTDLEKVNPGGIGAASFQFEMDSFTVYEELKTLYGYSKGVDVFLVNANTTKQGENHVVTAKSAIKLKFFQQNFTIDVNTPTDYSQLFDPTGLNMSAVTGGVTPVYVRSVTYGRMGIMVIESDSSSGKLYDAVYKQLGILKNLIGIDKNLTQEEKNIINNASIKVKYTGIGKDADETIKVTGIDGFVDVLSANKTYSKESPGVPVAFQLAYLDNDHAAVEAPFQINYGPFNKPYARIEYRNVTTNYTNNGNNFEMIANIALTFFDDEARQIPRRAESFIPFKITTNTESTGFSLNWPTETTIFNKQMTKEAYLPDKKMISNGLIMTVTSPSPFGGPPVQQKTFTASSNVYYKLGPSEFYNILPDNEGSFTRYDLPPPLSN